MNVHLRRVTGLAAAVLLFPAFALSQDEPEAKQPPEIPLLRPAGVYMDLPEQSADLTEMLLGGGTGKPHSFYEFLERIDELAESEHEQIVVDLSVAHSFQLVQQPELARALNKLRAAGKKTLAYIENADTADYQIAAQCDRVVMAELGVIDLAAPAMNVMFMKDALDLLGVHFDVVRCGDFKGAVEPYVLSQMSSHLREHYKTMLEHINRGIVGRISEGRKLEAAQVRELQGERLFTAKAALEAGLVDGLVPWQGAVDTARAELKLPDARFIDVLNAKKERRKMDFFTLVGQLFNPKSRDQETEENSIVVLHLSGTITDGDKDAPGSIVSKPTVHVIDTLRDDPNVLGAVVRVNSPGGSATASEAILIALRELAAAKPVIISFGATAASGGYYLACIGRPILAERETITGSIGVFGMKPSVGALMRRVGLHSELVALDDAGSMASIDQPWSDEQKAGIQAMINQVYEVFVGHVARSRGMSEDEILAIAGGRVWSGEQAVDNGLVDQLGGLEDAIAMVVAEAELDEAPEILHLPRPRNMFDALLADLMETEALLPEPGIRALARRLDLDRALRLLHEGLRPGTPPRAWTLWPEALTIR